MNSYLYDCLKYLNKIFSCFNDYLKDKIRVLVTHQVHSLTNASQILYMRDGQIEFRGSYQEVFLNLKINLDLLARSNQESSAANHDEEYCNISRVGSVRSVMSMFKVQNDSNNKEQEMCDEKAESNETVTNRKISHEYDEIKVKGLINVKTYFNYFRVGGGLIGAVGIVLTFIISQFLIVVSDYWISFW